MKTTRRNGFTLVEMLVAVAVFTLLAVMLTQVVFMTSQAITIDTKKLDSAAQARVFFDRLGRDLAARPTRSDLGGIQFTQDPASAYFQFYSAVSGYSTNAPTRRLSLVGYRIHASPTTGMLCLERGAANADWTAAGSPIFLPPSYLTQPAMPVLSDDDYDVLAEGAFRMEFCFLLTTGELSPHNYSATTGPATATDYKYVAGFVVALAVLDNRSRAQLTATQVVTLSTSFGTGPSPGADSMSSWIRGFNPSSITSVPAAAVNSIRFYERTFYVQ
jgi:prepilin-type N-terminal cleavage/methylation domain-containing protein